MSYYPTESLDVVWLTRTNGWRKISEKRRQVVTDVPARYRDLTLADLKPESARQRDAIQAIRSWVRRWGAFPTSGKSLDGGDDYRGIGLLITGPPGSGKTRAASIVANHMSLELNWSTKFIRAQDFYDLSKLPMRTNDPAEREKVESALDCYHAGWDGWRVMVLDDLGKEYAAGSGWNTQLFENLWRSRFTQAVPTIVTTNLTEVQLAEKYGESMGDYIYEAFEIVTVAGRSRKERRGVQQ